MPSLDFQIKQPVVGIPTTTCFTFCQGFRDLCPISLTDIKLPNSKIYCLYLLIFLSTDNELFYEGLSKVFLGPCQTPMMEVFAKSIFVSKIKTVKHICEKLHRRCFTRFWISLVVRKRLRVLHFWWGKIAKSFQKIRSRYHLSRNRMPIWRMVMCSDNH